MGSDNRQQQRKENGDKKSVTFNICANKAASNQDSKALTFETKEDAVAAFYELLANKGVRTRSTWTSIQCELRRDPRYCALKTEQERKNAFGKYKTDLIFASGNPALISAEKARLKQVRVTFKNYLREVLHLNRWDYIVETYFIDNDEVDDAHKIDIDEVCKELQGDERFHILDDCESERRAMIIDHIQVLEYQKKIQIQQDEKKKELEDKQDFMMLLHEISFGKIEPLFHARSTFQTLCQCKLFCEDARFLIFQSEENEEFAKQYFDEFCIAMDHSLEADKQILISFLRQNRYSIKYNDSVSKLIQCFGRKSRLSMIALSHLRLLFLEMIQQQQHLVDAGIICPTSSQRHNHRRDRSHSKYHKSKRQKYEKLKCKEKEDGEIEDVDERHSKKKKREKSQKQNKDKNRREKEKKSKHKSLKKKSRTSSKSEKNGSKSLSRREKKSKEIKTSNRRKTKTDKVNKTDSKYFKNCDDDRWKPSQTKKRKRENEEHKIVKKRRIIRNDSDRWRPDSYSSSSSKIKLKNDEKNKEEEKTSERRRSSRERMLRQKLLANVKKANR